MSDTTARARDLARELSELSEKASPRALDRFIDNNAAEIGALLMQMSDENERLHTVTARINDIHRGDQHVGDVFYALEAGEISIAKAMECVRSYLLTGETGEYAHAEQEPTP